MKIRANFLGLVLIGMIFGGILLSSAAGWWTTESSKVPAKFENGDFSGDFNPADIRGSYAFSDISQLFNIPQPVLAEAFMLPEGTVPGDFKNKDLEVLFEDLTEEDEEIGNASVQLFVALYTGLPFDLGEDIFLPEPAAGILKNMGILTGDQLEYVENHTIQLKNINLSLPAESDTTKEEDHSTETGTVKGNTTFYNLLDWGLTEEEIVAVIGAPMPNTGMLIRDYCTQNGLMFSELKVDFQQLVDIVLEE